jgi:hydroxymethylpyrimidine pyrophosphatase-like HAD family hydrolase
MLRGVGLGLAMANAVPLARAAAQHVLRRSNDEDGVAEAVERFLLR